VNDRGTGIRAYVGMSGYSFNVRESALVAGKVVSATSGRRFQTNPRKAREENCDDNNAAVRSA